MIEYYVMYLALRTWNPISTNPSIVPLKRINNKKTGKLLLFAMKTNMCNLMQSLQFFHVLLGVLCFLLQMFPNISSWVSWYFGGDNAPYPHPIGSMYGILYLPTFGWFLWWIGGKYVYIYIYIHYLYIYIYIIHGPYGYWSQQKTVGMSFFKNAAKVLMEVTVPKRWQDS